MAMVRQRFARNGSGGGAVTASFGSNITAGYHLVIVGTSSPDSHPGAAGTVAGAVRVGGGEASTGYWHDIFIYNNHPGGTTDVQYVPGEADSYNTVAVWEVSADDLLVLEDFVINHQDSAGTGTDAITSGLLSVSDGALVVCQASSDSGAGLTAGTGFSAGTNNGDVPSGGSFLQYFGAESQIKSGSGDIEGTWTADGNDNWSAIAASFIEDTTPTGEYINGLSTAGSTAAGGVYSFNSSLVVTEGNTLLLFLSNYTSGGVAIDEIVDTVGNVYTKLGTLEGGDNNHTIECWMTVSVASHAACYFDVNYDDPATFIAGFVAQYDGAFTFDAVSLGRQDGDDSLILPTWEVTTTGSNEKLIGFFVQWGGAFGGGAQSTSGNSTVRDQDGDAVYLVDAESTTPGVYTTQVEGVESNNPDYWRATWAFSLVGDEPTDTTPKLYANGHFYAPAGIISGGTRMKIHSNNVVEFLNIVELETPGIVKLYANGTFAVNSFSEIL